MSSRESLDDVLASPLLARSLFTVRAAISSASSSDEPRSRSESLMCSYWRARFVPFLVPRGGMTRLLFVDRGGVPALHGSRNAVSVRTERGTNEGQGEQAKPNERGQRVHR